MGLECLPGQYRPKTYHTAGALRVGCVGARRAHEVLPFGMRRARPMSDLCGFGIIHVCACACKCGTRVAGLAHKVI